MAHQKSGINSPVEVGIFTYIWLSSYGKLVGKYTTYTLYMCQLRWRSFIYHFLRRVLAPSQSVIGNGISEPSTVSWHIQIFFEASWNLQVDLLIVYVVGAVRLFFFSPEWCRRLSSNSITYMYNYMYSIYWCVAIILFACVSTDSPIFKPDSFVHQFIDLMIYLLVNPL